MSVHFYLSVFLYLLIYNFLFVVKSVFHFLYLVSCYFSFLFVFYLFVCLSVCLFVFTNFAAIWYYLIRFLCWWCWIEDNLSQNYCISPEQNQFECQRCYAKTETALLLKWSILEPSYAINLHIFVEVELYKIGLNSCSLRYTVHRELKINILCIFDWHKLNYVLLKAFTKQLQSSVGATVLLWWTTLHLDKTSR